MLLLFAAVVTVPAVAAMLLALAIPIVNGIITKATASTLVHDVVSIVLSACVALLAQRTGDGAAIISTEMALNVLVVYAVQLASYLKVWKPIGINGRLAPTRGIG